MTLNFDQFGTKIFFIFFRGAWDRVGVPRINSAHFELFLFFDRSGAVLFFVPIEIYLGGSGGLYPSIWYLKNVKFSGEKT
jgi:hypothetical protein|tara:strand:+ start:180 stop:419 length:240 start_codon:yes stop_codon:yes gene_type:complete